MPAPSTAVSSSHHDDERARSYAILQAARDEAISKRKYDSALTRSKLVEEFRARTGGKTPYDWQVDVAEALLLGVDCTVIAGTGSGKTMPFVMPAFVDSHKTYIIISPLNALERDQGQRFAQLRVSAAVLNGTTYTGKLLEVRKLLSKPSFSSRVGAFIIDEAHCIAQWGGDFRTEYATLEDLRSQVPTAVPFLATSATMTPAVLSQIRSQLCIRCSSSFHLNLGNDRVNIKHEVRYMRSASDYSALDFIVKGASKASDLPRTLVFVNQIHKCHAAAHRLRGIVHGSLRDSIGILHAKRCEKSKADAWEEFRVGHTRVLVATEAAAMGMDVPDIELVVQFGVPENLCVWLQRAGRAGRSLSVQARAVMLVEVSVVQEVKPSKREAEPDENSDSEFYEEEEQNEERTTKAGYKKNIEEHLRRWIETTGCRRAVADAYFDNPPRGSNNGRSPTLCCDNCEHRAQSTTTSGSHPNPEPSLPGMLSQQPASDAKPLSTSGRQSPLRRVDDHLRNVKAALKAWRLQTRRDKYAGTSLKAENILPDRNLQTIASHRRGIKTVEDLRRILKPPWAFVDVHGPDVLHLVQKLDEQEDERRHLRALQAREIRKRETEQRKAAVTAAKAAQREAVRRQKQWAQSVTSYSGPLGPSSALNAPLPPPQGLAYYAPTNRAQYTIGGT
ncbi:P-loop containing nucleoside triphosphate hydrolase protein [Trametes polyzona]|nr:P-loop containing nucleoside triphosphate hydrolase protein [Trametes polyzona]